MKQFSYITFILLFLVQMSFGQEKGYNYVRTSTKISESDNLDQIDYYDGLGREWQTVKKGFTTYGTDLITLKEYDKAGRVEKVWLPISFYQTGNHISNTDYNTLSNFNYKDDCRFTQYTYDNSPLNRIIATSKPGQDFHLTNKQTRCEYLSNGSTLYCNKYTLIKNGDSYSITKNGIYPNGTLEVQKTTDEDQHVKYVYTDMFGHTILSSIIGENGERFDTYYVYDYKGNLIYILPPAASNELTTNGSTWTINNCQKLKNFAYLYKYDYRNQCIEKKMPGCEPIYFTYDKAGRLIFSQDGNLRKEGKYFFYLYDTFGRKVVRGICTLASVPDLKNEIVTATYSSNGKYAFYDANIELNNVKLLNAHYYGSYSVLSHLTDKYKKNLGRKNIEGYYQDPGMTWHPTFKDLQTVTLTYDVEDDSKFYAKTTYYDTKGRIIQTHENNSLNGWEDYYYDVNYYTGSINKSLHRHSINCPSRLEEDADTLVIEKYRYTYDRQGRLDSTIYQLNDNQEYLVATNMYDELGNITRVTRNAAEISTDYNYDVRNNIISAKNQLTEQYIYYNKEVPFGSSTPSYNGNISAYEWRHKDANGHWLSEAYAYTYDNLDRLLEGYSCTTDRDGNKQKGLHDVAYSYDEMGNILAIRRAGVNFDDKSTGLRDDASLTYNGNQLTHINNHGFKDSSFDTQIEDHEYSDVDEFDYDANGNMTRNLNKGILKIEYNVLNLPKNIYLKDKYITLHYDANGTLREKTRHFCDINLSIPESGILDANLEDIDGNSYNSRSDILYQFYCDNCIYNREHPYMSLLERGSELTRYQNITYLDRINFCNGYIIDTQEPTYLEYVKDYLGNIRFVAENGNVITQANDYYPFGGFYNENKNENEQPWRFGGKEMDRDIDEYDFSARWYDPTGIHFNSIDPCADVHPEVSPYSFCANNPIKYIDPTGCLIGDYYDTRGVHIGNDGNKDYRKYIVINKNDARTISINNKNGSTTPITAIASAISLPSEDNIKAADYIYEQAEAKNIEYGYYVSTTGEISSIFTDNQASSVKTGEGINELTEKGLQPAFDVHVHPTDIRQDTKDNTIYTYGDPKPSGSNGDYMIRSVREQNKFVSEPSWVLGTEVILTNPPSKGNRIITFYNSKGNISTISWNKFKSTIQKVRKQ